jgi:trigger factor
MNVIKKQLEKSQVELTVELSVDEMKPYIKLGAEKVSREVKIDGFRSGKVPYEILKSKIGEQTILEEAAHIAINKTIDKAINENMEQGQAIGQPQISITKLAPENPLEYKIVIAIIPEIKLGEYKDLKIKMDDDISVQDEEAMKTVEYLRESGVKEIIADREAKDGDKVLVDIEIFLDKVPVEGGQGKGVAIIIGKDYIVPGFDKNLINAKKGEVKDFSLPYPADHHMANLAGKMVEHRVKINEVYARELPEMNDEFAVKFGLKSYEELKNNIKKNLEAEKKQKAEQKAEIEMLDKIVKNSKFGDIPEMLVNSESHTMLHELEHSVTHQGGKFEDYLGSIKKTKEQLMLDLLPDAVKRVKSALVIREIALAEKIEISEKEVEEKIEELLKQYKGYEKVAERVKEPSYKAYLENTLVNKKVIEKLREWNFENR